MTAETLPLVLQPSPVFILGAGRAGRALARACHAGGIPIVGLHGRSASPGDPDRVTVGPIPAAIADAGIVLVTVRDMQMEEALSALSESAIVPGAVVLHASGATEPEGLERLRAAGHPSGTFHPLAPLADASAGPETMRGAYVGVDGDPEATATAPILAGAHGSRPVRLPHRRKSPDDSPAVMSAVSVP